MKAISRQTFTTYGDSAADIIQHVNDLRTKPVTVVEVDEAGVSHEINTVELCIDEDAVAAANVVDSVLNTQRGELQLDTERGIRYLETIFSSPHRRLEWETEMREAIERMPFVTELDEFKTSIVDDGQGKRSSHKKIVFDARIKTKFADESVDLSDSRTITLKTLPVAPHANWEVVEDVGGTKFSLRVKPGETIMLSVVCEEGTSIRWNDLDPDSVTFAGKDDIICTHTFTAEEFAGIDPDPSDRRYLVYVTVGRGITNFHVIGGHSLVTSVVRWATTIKDASYTFRNCANIEEVCNWTNIVENISYCYEGCAKLKGVKNDGETNYHVPEFTQSITNCEHAYYGCSSLVAYLGAAEKDERYMPHEIDSSGIFEDCYAGATAAIRAKVTQVWGGDIIDIEENTPIDSIRYCSTLKFTGAVTINATFTIKTEVYAGNLDGEGKFTGFTKIATFNAGTFSNQTINPGGKPFVRFSMGLRKLTFASGKDKVEQVRSFGSRWIDLSGAFSGCTNLSYACAFHDAAKNVTSCYQGCTKLATVAGLDTSTNFWKNIDSVESCFDGCANLTIEAGKNIAPFSGRYSSVNYCFRGCAKLTGNVPQFSNAHKTAIGCFQGCAQIGNSEANEIRWGNQLTNVNDCFNGCTNLKMQSTVVPAFPASVTTAQRCYKGCSSIASRIIDLSQCKAGINVTSCFEGCTGILTDNNKVYDKDIMPESVGPHTDYVKGCAKLVVRKFTTAWGGIRPAVSYQEYIANKAGQFLDFDIDVKDSAGVVQRYIDFSLLVSNKSFLVFGLDSFARIIDLNEDARTDANGEQYDTYSRNGNVITFDCSQMAAFSSMHVVLVNTVAADAVVSAKYPASSITQIKVVSDKMRTLIRNFNTWSNTVTEESEAFKNCTGLSQIPDSFGTSITNLKSCFEGCTNLRGRTNSNTTLPDWSACSGCTSVEKCYKNCTRLVGTGVPTWPAACTNAVECFYGCTALTASAEGIPSSWGSITNATNCFYNCTALNGTPSDWSSMVYAENCYYNCSQLTGMIPLWKTSLVNVRRCYYGCAKLTGNTAMSTPSTAMPGYLGGVQTDDDFNAGKSDAEKRYHSECVRGAGESVRKCFLDSWGGSFNYGPAIFTLGSNNKKVKEKHLNLWIVPGMNTDQIVKADWGDGNAFVKNGNTGYDDDDEKHPYLFEANQNGWCGRTSGGGIEEIGVQVQTGDHSFNASVSAVLSGEIKVYNAKALAIGSETDTSALKVYTNGSENFPYILSFSDDNNAQCAAFGIKAFFKQVLMTSVSATSVTEVGESCFEGCSKLESMNLPSLNYLGSRAFYGCSKLKTINLGAVSSIGEKVFNSCSSVTNITIEAMSTIPASCFSRMKKVEELSIGEVGHICEKAFYQVGSSNKTTDLSIELPQLASGSYVQIDGQAFASAKFMNISVDTPNDPDSCTQIADKAFYNLTKSASVVPTINFPNLVLVGEVPFDKKDGSPTLAKSWAACKFIARIFDGKKSKKDCTESTADKVYKSDCIIGTGWKNCRIVDANGNESTAYALSYGWSSYSVGGDPEEVAIPVARTDLVANGTTQTGVPSGVNYTITGNTASAAENYTATATLVGGNYVWTDGTTAAKSIPWSIAAPPDPPA